MEPYGAGRASVSLFCLCSLGRLRLLYPLLLLCWALCLPAFVAIFNLPNWYNQIMEHGNTQ